MIITRTKFRHRNNRVFFSKLGIPITSILIDFFLLAIISQVIRINRSKVMYAKYSGKRPGLSKHV